MRAVEPPTATDEPVHLEECEQDHEQLPVRFDPLFAQAVGKLLARLVRLLRQRVENDRTGPAKIRTRQSVGLRKLPDEERTDARRGQFQQPSDVLG